MIFNKPKQKLFLILDIGNRTVTSGLVMLDKNSLPKILNVSKKVLHTEEDITKNKLQIKTTEALRQVMIETFQKSQRSKWFNSKIINIDNVLISISAPWYTSDTKLLSLKNEKEFYITENFLSDIEENEALLIEKSIEDTNQNRNYEIVEKLIVNCKINGYSTKEILHKKTKDFEASVYVSISSTSFIDKIRSIVYQYTHIQPDRVFIHTFPFICEQVISSYFNNNESYLILDLSGEMTDIAYVKRNLIEKTISFPSGRNFIIKSISKILKLSTDIAESTLTIYLAEKLDADTTKKIEEILISVRKEWLAYLQSSLYEISHDYVLPNTIYMVSDNDIQFLYESFLKSSDLDELTLWRNSLKIIHLNTDTMKTFFQSQTVSTQDHFVSILSIFLNKFLNS